MRLPSWLEAVAVAVAIATANGCNSSTPASRLPPTGPTPPVATGSLTVVVEGQVTEFDRGEPVPGGTVALDGVSTPSGQTPVNLHAGAMTDEQGRFRFTATVPTDWRALRLLATTAGYESNFGQADRTNVTAVRLQQQRELVIRPGESIQVNSYLGAPCFAESVPCRKILVQTPPGEAIEVEAIPTNPNQRFVLFAGLLSSQPYSIDQVQTSRVSVSGGEVWVMPLTDTSQREPVTLKAHRR